MFVISVNDNGEERNLVASHVRVVDSFLLVKAGAASHAFPVETLIDIIAVDAASANLQSTSREIRHVQLLID
jgi:hypothetical protein